MRHKKFRILSVVVVMAVTSAATTYLSPRLCAEDGKSKSLPAGTAANPASANLAKLDRAQQDRLHEQIAPAAEENKWLDIGWETDLIAAQKRAMATGKPIFLWQMDGHPLGCV